MIELDTASGSPSGGTSDGSDPFGDALRPEFFAAFRRSGTLGPERLLMLAVLENAVTCYRRYARTHGAEARRWFQEADEWLHSDDRTGLYAFETICDALDIHPDWVRRNLGDAPTRFRRRETPRVARRLIASGRPARRASQRAA